MSQFEEVIAQCKRCFEEKLGRRDYNEALLTAIAKSLGPSIYNNDSSKVACSKKEERNHIKTSFLIKKLGLDEDHNLDAAITEVCKAMGSSNRNKYRIVFYYLLVEKFGKASVFETSKTTSKTKAPSNSKSSPKSSSKTKITKKNTGKKSAGSSSEIIELKPNDKGILESSDDIINKYALGAAAAGLVPIPLVDIASITAVQYNMIKRLAQNYKHVSFDNKKTKSILVALAGGITSFELGLITRVIFKSVPFFGPIIGGTAVSGFAYSSTKGIGEIFDAHFASGGDLSIEDLTLKKMKETFKLSLKK